MFDFREKFKDRSTVELLQMLEQPQKYQPDAITAAKEILETRKEKDLKAFEEASVFAQEKERKTISTKQDTSTKKTLDIWEEDEIDKSNKVVIRNHILSILFVYIVMNCMLLFRLTTDANRTFADMELMDWAPTLASFTFAIVGIIFFFKREKTGWILLVFDFTHRAILNIQLLILSIRYISNPYIHFSIYNNVLPLALFGLVLFRLSSARLMAQYKATRQTLVLTIGASILFVACVVFAQRFA